MIELTRIELYRWVLERIAEGENYEGENIGLLNEKLFHNIEPLKELIKFNILILEDIEIKFISNREYEEELLNFGDLVNTLRNKRNPVISDIIDELIEDVEKSKNIFYAFNRIIKKLTKYNNDVMKHIMINRDVVNKIRQYTKGNRVFLSYAYEYEDRLYTLCLFIYMAYRDVNLYVDWICCDNNSPNFNIKQNLHKELQNSNQLLLLRTVNSELNIRGRKMIRGWCSWELGVFYNVSSGSINKYYIELYCDNDKNNLDTIDQLDGINKLTGIVNGRLI